VLSYTKEVIEGLAMHFRAGRTFTGKLKVATVYVASILRRSSPPVLKRRLDAIMKGAVVETDVRFSIRTLHDFYVVSFRWEKWLDSAFKFEKGMTFLDVGAHVGKYTLRAAFRVGNKGKVIAVEPNKENFDVLVKNITLNGLSNCVPLNVAAYSSDGEVLLFKGADSTLHSIKEDFGEGSYKVKARALDNVLEEIGVKKLDLVKIDVEGAELEVLKGMEKTLKKQNPTMIIEILRRDEDKVLDYLNHLAYKATLLRCDPNYRGGLSHYRFDKSSGNECATESIHTKRGVTHSSTERSQIESISD
jgi:FkbM family methyltransferase